MIWQACLFSFPHHSLQKSPLLDHIEMAFAEQDFSNPERPIDYIITSGPPLIYLFLFFYI